MSATDVHSPSRDAAAGTAGMNGMSQYTAPTLTIGAADGTTYAYRRFGQRGTVPVVFLQHFRGNLDNWDPALPATVSCSSTHAISPLRSTSSSVLPDIRMTRWFGRLR